VARSKPFDEHELMRFARAYKRGEPTAELAKRFEIAPSSVNVLRARLGLQRRSARVVGRLVESDVVEAVRAQLNGGGRGNRKHRTP